MRATQSVGRSPAGQFEALCNFRDCGGLPTRTGSRTRFGELYRSDSLARCTSADLEQLKSLGIGRVVDLRTPEERASHGTFDHRGTGIDYVHVPLIDETWFPRLSPAQGQTWDDYLLVRYREVLTDRGGRLAHALTQVAAADNPTVVHCTAGKDRTGVLIALLLAAVGVHDESIADDYEASAAGSTRLGQQLAEQAVAAGQPDYDGQAGIFAAADRATALRLLEWVRARHGGSVVSYLLSVGTPAWVFRDLRYRLVV